MRDPKFVSVAARIPHVHLHTETYLHSGPKRTTKKLIKWVFLTTKKIVQKAEEMSFFENKENCSEKQRNENNKKDTEQLRFF